MPRTLRSIDYSRRPSRSTLLISAARNSKARSFLDLERIEILSGPQGTLLGRNATAGAIKLITDKPGNTLEGKCDVDLANFDTLEGMLNVPISAPLACEQRAQA